LTDSKIFPFPALQSLTQKHIDFIIDTLFSKNLIGCIKAKSMNSMGKTLFSKTYSLIEELLHPYFDVTKEENKGPFL